MPPTTAELAPLPRPVTPMLSAAGLFSEIAPPAEVVTRLPVLGPAADLDTAAAQAHITAELATLTTARIDLFSPDPVAALSHLQAAAASTGLSVGVDGVARDRIKTKHAGGFALYTEAATATDVAKLLAKLAARLQQGAPLAATAHLAAAGVTDLRDLKDLFGEPKRTATRDPKDDSTIGQVVKQLNGPAAKRPALVFALPRPAVGSKELRSFLDARGERKPDTVVLLIVVRSPDPN